MIWCNATHLHEKKWEYATLIWICYSVWIFKAVMWSIVNYNCRFRSWNRRLRLSVSLMSMLLRKSVPPSVLLTEFFIHSLILRIYIASLQKTFSELPPTMANNRDLSNLWNVGITYCLEAIGTTPAEAHYKWWAPLSKSPCVVQQKNVLVGIYIFFFLFLIWGRP